MRPRLKKTRAAFYLESYFLSVYRRYRKMDLDRIFDKLNDQQIEDVNSRVDYCMKLSTPFKCDMDVAIKDFKRGKGSAYYFDIKKYLVNFDGGNEFNYLFGDVVHVPDKPTFVKSRPICSGNGNSILLKMDSIRHYNFFTDPFQLEDKIDMAVWRGMSPQPHRKKFVDQFYNSGLCDVGQVDKALSDQKNYKPYMSVRDQFKFKYIISLEGYDVATNLKWIMASNSAAIMPKSKFETWFLEGSLIPDHHYISIEDDYSNLEEKIDYCNRNPDFVRYIVGNANRYVSKYRCNRTEDLVSMLVLKKFFSLSGQI